MSSAENGRLVWFQDGEGLLSQVIDALVDADRLILADEIAEAYRVAPANPAGAIRQGLIDWKSEGGDGLWVDAVLKALCVPQWPTPPDKEMSLSSPPSSALSSSPVPPAADPLSAPIEADTQLPLRSRT